MEMIEDIREALPEIGRLLRSVAQSTSSPGPPQKQAIRAVWSAVDHTRMHLAKLGEEEEHKPNPELVELWSEASLGIAAFHEELAHQLRVKAEYWSDPRNWDRARCKEAGIQIEDIAQRARALLQLAVPTPEPMKESAADGAEYFVSHASEDKNEVAEPLAGALVQRGYTVWYDNFTLQIGDSLRDEVDRGLSSCRYGVVILSRSFFAKPWPKRELNGLLALETADGRKRVLPVWHQVDHAAVAAYSPILADRLAVSTVLGIDEVANQIVQACAA